MNYLDYPRHDDRPAAKRLRDRVAEHQQVSRLRILDAKANRDRGNNIGVANCVLLARHESRQAQAALRELRAMEATS